MDKQCHIFQELNSMQSNITTLFQEIVRERNEFMLNIGKLSAELKDATRENDALKQSHEELKKLIFECLKLFKKMSINETTKTAVETIKETFLQNNRKIEQLLSGPVTSEKIPFKENQTSAEPSTRRLKLDDKAIKKEIESLNELHFSALFEDDERDKSTKIDVILNKNKSELVLEKLFDRSSVNQSEMIEKLNEPVLVGETESHDTQSISSAVNLRFRGPLQALTEDVTPKKECAVTTSPVFKDFVNRKSDNLAVEELENVNDKVTSKSLNEKFVLKPAVNLFKSPLKRLSIQANSSSPKRTRVKLNLNSPQRSPSHQLKKSNSTEAEVSLAGVRKLTQTVLNVDCFRKKSPEKRTSRGNVENEDLKDADDGALVETKFMFDEDEDDVIIESPKIREQVLEDIENKRRTGREFVTPHPTEEVDLDETFVSSSIVRKCKLAEKHVLERIIEDQTPKRNPREKSPECDSVPFRYKREAVRKKAERMKMPGHACPQCDRYYREVFENEADSHELRQILNKCSRHRDNNSPTLEETPPGYWKPYLTCTAVSPGKDDTALR